MKANEYERRLREHRQKAIDLLDRIDNKNEHHRQEREKCQKRNG